MRGINNSLKKRKKHFYSWLYIDIVFFLLIGVILIFGLKALKNPETDRCDFTLWNKNKDGMYVLTCKNNDENKTIDVDKKDTKDIF